ncbi:MAG TPA: tRNA uridine-5-carboxymethylaminomethyl(34) synthesis GTPase MnmE [Terriglobales bacterium]|nr:tRNA uridine-5-carboxymethylaminomethyl(34) synthesis GTPase MnmE [Terriglobales bacterium]
MNHDDTIVAVATPPGRGGLGILRLSGAEAKAIALKMLRLAGDLVPRHATMAELIDASPSREAAAAPTTFAESSRLDEAIVTYFQGPHSYTAEDAIEISCHGSPVVLRRAIEIAVSHGARLAEPGEFTMRAFLNGRIDLTQAEAVRDLIEAQTLFQAKVAVQQLEGALANRLRPIKQALVELIALLEAGIDFAEDDVPVAAGREILPRIAAVREPLQQLARSFAYGKVVHEGLTLAIVGRPNVGKSSLFNRLVERDRAIVTAAPGTTRDLVSETVALGGVPVRLVDTAGIRKSNDEAESIGIRKSMEALVEADVVLLVHDMAQPLTEEDTMLADRLQDRAAISVWNKADLADEATRATTLQLMTSAITGEGISELRQRIVEMAGAGAAQEPGFLTNTRHQALVNDSLAALDRAEAALRQEVPHEMLLLDLYTALRPLDEMTGATTADDILNLIFSRFCIGK